jgi:hypothetical protein
MRVQEEEHEARINPPKYPPFPFPLPFSIPIPLLPIHTPLRAEENHTEHSLPESNEAGLLIAFGKKQIKIKVK